MVLSNQGRLAGRTVWEVYFISKLFAGLLIFNTKLSVDD